MPSETGLLLDDLTKVVIYAAARFCGGEGAEKPGQFLERSTKGRKRSSAASPLLGAKLNVNVRMNFPVFDVCLPI